MKRFADLPLDGKPVKGSWELLPNHEVGYRAEGRGGEIRFKAPIVAVEPDALVVVATVRQDDQTVVTRTVRIAGRWKSDQKNRITFEFEKTGGRTDVLTFTGTWKLNDAHEIVYSYRSEALQTRVRTGAGRTAGRKTAQEITFRGFWELSDKRHLTYVLSADADSAFRFRGAFQTPSIFAKKGEIRFQIGAEVTGTAAGRTKARAAGQAGRANRSAGEPAGHPTVVTLFGAWKLGRDLALSFELDQPGSRKQVLRFGGEVKFAGPRTLSVNLRSERGTPLGVELLLTREFAGGDGELFARLARSSRESLVEAGGRLRF